jgi:hypothetical protein
MNMTKEEQVRFVEELTDNLKAHMLDTINHGHVPQDWDGHELRHWALSVVQNKFVFRPLEGKRKKEFKNHLIINPNL